MAKPKNLKDDILKLRNNGHSYSYIQKTLKCSKSSISYYCGKDQINKTKNRKKNRFGIQPLLKKIENFCSIKTSKSIDSKLKCKTSKLLYERIRKFHMTKKKTYEKPTFTTEQLLDKIGNNPKCYLTGIEIDISKPSTYQLDHIIPRSKGGDNSLENLGLCIKQANAAKNDMTPDELLCLCKNILEHNGYSVTKHPRRDSNS